MIFLSHWRTCDSLTFWGGVRQFPKGVVWMFCSGEEGLAATWPHGFLTLSGLEKGPRKKP